MGYELTNASGDSQQWTVISWWHLLNIGLRYGWKPAETEGRASKADPQAWTGSYFARAGQTVRADDATALASALESFFNDVCRDEIAGEVAERMQEVIDGTSGRANSQRFGIFTEPVELVRSMPKSERTIPVWSFSEQDSTHLQAFIAFCRKGAFTIR